TIYLGGVSFAIVGVGPPEFYGETLQPDPPGFWLPLSADRQLNREFKLIDDPDEHWLYLMGRLKPGISTAQAQTRLTATLRNWLLAREGSAISAGQRGKISRSYVELTPGGSGIAHMQRAYSRTLRLLLGISIAVLLITCANIANLLLARGAARTAETSLRLALGASRGRLVRQSLAESLTLALAGGALGLLAASAGTKLLIALFFRGTDYVPIHTSPDFRVLAFTFALSCGAAIVFGLLPAIRRSSRSASPGLKSSRMSHRPFGLGAALIIGEVALSLVVLAGAGTFARSLANLSGQQFGFDRGRVLVVNIDTARAGYGYARLGPLYRQMCSRLNSLPGVKSASFSDYSPFNECCEAFSVGVQGYSPKPGERMSVRLNRVSPGYFETLGTKVLLGRGFNERDTPASRPVAVVTEEFVHRFFPNENPIGRRFGIGGERNAGELEIRSSGHLETIAAEVRRALAEIDPRLPVLRVGTLADHVRLMLNQENVIAALAMFFGLVALVLSCLGLYGLTAYTFERRTGEIGIRIALGARRGAVIGMVIREALVLG
ncbi:MAG: FtsX-like permease family protein, partial [Pseudomonadota bacterium]